MFALSLSGCDESMTNEMDTIIDIVTDSPTDEPVTPAVEPVEPITDAQAVISVNPTQIASPTPGERLNISINIAGTADVAAYEVTVGFDPTALRYVEAAHADYLPAGAFAVPPKVSTKKVYLAATSLTGPATASSGTLATVTFEVVASKASTIQLMNVLLSNSAAESLIFTTVNGEVTDASTDEPVTPAAEPIDPTTDIQTEPTVLPTDAQTVISVNPAQVSSPVVGQQLHISINITGTADVAAYEVTVGFDPTALRYVEAAHADYLPAGAFAVPPKVSTKKVYLAATSLTGPATASSGTLATVTFEVVASKASTIQLMNVLLSNSAAESLIFTTINGEVTAP